MCRDHKHFAPTFVEVSIDIITENMLMFWLVEFLIKSQVVTENNVHLSLWHQRAVQKGVSKC